jgi:cytidine deaminase
LTASGAVVTGCNVENASYGLSVCAERAAIHRAIAEGHRDLVAVAVASGRTAAMPCGACRQVMAEFGVRAVIVDRPGTGPREYPLTDLLSHPFAGTRLARRGHL